MVIVAAWGIVAACLAAGPESGADASESVRSVLARGGYPWYDAPADTVRPVLPPEEPEEEPSPVSENPHDVSVIGVIGRWLVFFLMALGLAALIGGLVWLWWRYGPEPDQLIPAARRSAPVPAQIGSLPAGLQVDLSDPWREAVRRREIGDYAGAILYLFAHQLLTLDRLQLARLAPGRTARQLVRAVPKATVRGWVAPTLRLFEAVYYGHHAPSVEDFEAAWSEAEALERWVAAGASS